MSIRSSLTFNLVVLAIDWKALTLISQVAIAGLWKLLACKGQCLHLLPSNFCAGRSPQYKSLLAHMGSCRADQDADSRLPGLHDVQGGCAWRGSHACAF